MPDDKNEKPEKKPRTQYNYEGNSHKSKDDAANPEEEPKDEKKIRQVTTAKIRKPSLGKRLAETFTGDDAQSVGQYILFDVLVPAFKNAVADAVSGGIERMMFGDSRGRRGSSSSYSSKGSYTPYNRYSSPSDRDRDRDRGSSSRVSSRVRHGHEEVIVEDREDARDIVGQLIDLVERFDVATVPDLYAMIGKTPSFTDEKYGWVDAEDLKRVEIRRLRDGWLIDLPRPEYLD